MHSRQHVNFTLKLHTHVGLSYVFLCFVDTAKAKQRVILLAIRIKSVSCSDALSNKEKYSFGIARYQREEKR